LGVLCAQIVHAAGESGPAAPGTYAVVLAVPDEARLQRLAARLQDEGLNPVLIHEPDRNNELMTVGLRPAVTRPRVLRGLPLLSEVTPCIAASTT
jgi:hypothetical protein